MSRWITDSQLVSFVISTRYESNISVRFSTHANRCQIVARSGSGMPIRTRAGRFLGRFSGPSWYHSTMMPCHSSSWAAEQFFDTSPVPLSSGSSPSEL